MMYKKGQAQMITTVLIILLVLAAIVIVWQVVNTTINKGATEIEERSDCVGLSIDITNVDATGNKVVIKPNKAIDGFRIFVAGSEATAGANDSNGVGAFSTSTQSQLGTITVGDKVTTAGKIGVVWCDGLNSVTAT